MKISHYGNQNHEMSLVQVTKKMVERFADFENQEIQELKENSENQNTTKVHSPGSFLDQLG